MKFSIIVPMYNVEKYIGKCLESIMAQKYENYEVIIVNDGSTDNSVDVVKEYLTDKRFKLYNKDNSGVSATRNYGIGKVTGDYIIFVDSDDYITKDLLYNINKVLVKHNYDIVKYGCNLVDDEYNLIRKEKTNIDSKKVDTKEMLNFEFSEPPWAFAYNAKFFVDNKFSYAEGRVHEDYGLTPLIILKAKDKYYLKYYGYNYVQRNNSIVHGMEKNIRRCNDMLYHFDNLYDIISKDNKIDNETKLFAYSYLANALIIKAKLLTGKNLDNYIKELKKRHVADYLLADSIARKVKKTIIKIMPKLYIKLFTK